MITVKKYSAPPLSKSEIMRYAGASEENDEINALLKECVQECENALTYSVCYDIFDIRHTKNGVAFPFCETASHDLSKALDSCDRAVIFAATLGIGIDRLLVKNSKLSPAKALMLQAIGTERIESLCDTFLSELQAELKKDSLYLLPRVSPGYGDISILMQEDIFCALSCTKNIGVSLSGSLFMTPSKSVTAIVGISKKECSKVSNCADCALLNCEFRR